MPFISIPIITLLSIGILGIYGFCYYRFTIKKAKDLFKIYLGERQYREQVK